MYELVIKYAPNYLKESYVNMISKNILSSPAHLQYEFQILVFVNKGSFHIEQNVFVKHNTPIMANSNEGQDHKENILIPVERSCHKK